ncbi:MAG: HlyD family type I secretion periplasmic adaptor subunit [Paludibacterium sp.]|uniref:HlyD family type I secretion periplasmic adaptor subunit n=1 Tax=Paludibacterium sp. TaxID=1917523 RepID=UPI0025FF04A6|nr:HlyD family type I secretion periplasmic adaptor subunit [Paludibacterium sp.]MBV8048086.1 HlyD family type I secretion periplasmic adaptor subunit [Paludibacterium sp.]MBV8648901.1 HlyD family type I secretion periplasmic adaptor subunit [Paludibacterium sp.]
MSRHALLPWRTWLTRGQAKTAPLWDRLMDWAAARDLQEPLDFAADADWIILEQHPARPRLFVWSMGAFGLVAFLWSALAQIDEVTKGQGKVVASSQNQHIQSLDGGVVATIRVHEGQIVQKGQLLLSIDNTRFVSSLQASRAEYLALLGKAARLRAIAQNTAFEMPAEVLQQAPDIAEQETGLYRAKKQEYDETVQIARQELSQRAQELDEMRARRQQAEQSYQLTNRELEQTRPLLDSGAVSAVDLLRLQRDVARFQGDRNMADAQIARLQAAVVEANRKIREVDLSFRNLASAELSDTLAKLDSLSADSKGLANKVKLSELRSPVRGEIKQLYANTVGGVVQPGKDVMEIVPIGDSLLVETRVSPRDIAFLRPGQTAKVKFTAYDYTIYGGMDGVVETLGADTEADERGNTFYIVKVRTRQGSLGDKHLPIIPGMVAQVDIMTGKKSILSYLLKPVLRAKAEALSER